MPTTYTDQFWTLDPYSPPPAGTALNVSVYDLIDQDDDDDIEAAGADSVDGSDVTDSWPGDTVTVNLPGGGTTTVTGTTFYLADGRRVFTPTDGSVLFDTTIVSATGVTTQGPLDVGDLGPPCFTPGTEISTRRGPVKVEDLRPGDLIETLDRGPQPVLYIYERTLDAPHLEANPAHRPVRIPAGALGEGIPARPLTVSPQHRMLIRSPIAARMFDAAEILVPAVALTGHRGITRVTSGAPVRYIHVLLDHHAIIKAESAPTETLYLGQHIHEALTRAEVDAMRAATGLKAMPPARALIKGRRTRRLLERHKRNGKMLVGELTDDALATAV